jgi:hypothetical protein
LLIGFVGLVLLSASNTGAAQTNDKSPLEIESEVLNPATTDSVRFALVTMRNTDTQGDITDLSIQTGRGDPIVIPKQDSLLLPGQSRAFRVEFAPQPNQSYLLISFVWNRQPQSVAKVLRVPDSEQKSIGTLWVPAVSSLLGVLVGAALLHLLTARRERSSFYRSWGKEQFTRNESALRAFLTNWRGDPSPTALEGHFKVFESSSPVPTVFRDEYNRVLSILKNAGSNSDQKKKACDTLRDKLELFLLKPWTFTSWDLK